LVQTRTELARSGFSWNRYNRNGPKTEPLLTLGIPYGTLRDQSRGAQPRSAAHEKEQLLTVEEGKSIVRFCETLDDLGHPLQVKMVKAFAMSLLSSTSTLATTTW